MAHRHARQYSDALQMAASVILLGISKDACAGVAFAPMSHQSDVLAAAPVRAAAQRIWENRAVKRSRFVRPDLFICSYSLQLKSPVQTNTRLLFTIEIKRNGMGALYLVTR